MTWRVQGEFRTGSVGTGRASVALQNAFIRYNPGAWAVQAGQFKTPFTREFIASLADIETADRATIVDSPAVRNQAWTAGLNVYPSGRNLRLTFDYLSREIGEPGVRKGRLLAQVQAKF